MQIIGERLDSNTEVTVEIEKWRIIRKKENRGGNK